MRSLLEIENLSVAYRIPGGEAQVLKQIGIRLDEGRALGLVGESGSGKSTVAAAITGMLPSSGFVQAGRILFEGQDLLQQDQAALRALRGRRIATIPQDAASALNPVLRIEAQIAEVMSGSARTRRERAVSLFEEVRISNPRIRLDAYPHMLTAVSSSAFSAQWLWRATLVC